MDSLVPKSNVEGGSSGNEFLVVRRGFAVDKKIYLDYVVNIRKVCAGTVERPTICRCNYKGSKFSWSGLRLELSTTRTAVYDLLCQLS